MTRQTSLHFATKPRTGSRRTGRVRLWLEGLEAREVPSFTPAQIQHAYGFDQLGYSDNLGNPIAADGTGQTIALITAFDAPNVASNLHTFDTAYALPDPTLTVHKMSDPLQGNAGWVQEAATDVEWSHAIAPGANLLLVEASSASDTDIVAAIDYARSQPGVSVVSMSFGAQEAGDYSYYDSYFTAPDGHAPVTFLAGAGDDGGLLGTTWPAVSTHVIGVGATSLYLDASGDYLSESGWILSGGGTSRHTLAPDFQSGVNPGTYRTTPDVSIVGASGTGVSIYYTYPGVMGGFTNAGGTSVSTPMWAGLIAIADQGRSYLGADPLDGYTQTLPALYSLADTDFTDITTGRNFVATAGPGYDKVTGIGTPAYWLVYDLSFYTGSPSPAPSSLAAAPATPLAPVGTVYFLHSDSERAFVVLEPSADAGAEVPVPTAPSVGPTIAPPAAVLPGPASPRGDDRVPVVSVRVAGADESSAPRGLEPAPTAEQLQPAPTPVPAVSEARPPRTVRPSWRPQFPAASRGGRQAGASR